MLQGRGGKLRLLLHSQKVLLFPFPYCTGTRPVSQRFTLRFERFAARHLSPFLGARRPTVLMEVDWVVINGALKYLMGIRSRKKKLLYVDYLIACAVIIQVVRQVETDLHVLHLFISLSQVL